MVFSKDDKILIKSLYEIKGYGARKLLKEFPQKNWTRGGLDTLIRKIRDTGTVERTQGSGRPRSTRTDEAITAVEDLVLSQEDRPQTHRSTRQISREIGVSQTSVIRIIHEDLELKCLKKRRAQELTAANKLTRLTRSKQLLRRYSKSDVDFIWFTDEKVFTIAAPSNAQNDRIYVPKTKRKKEISAERLLRTRSTFSKSLMVSVGVSKLGQTDLVFVEPGVKINGAYYRDFLLKKELLPTIRQISGDMFIFQQDNAPAHRARDTVQFLKRETPAFISPDLWPPNSPDLNPVDYKIWATMQQRVYKTKINDINELRERLSTAWNSIEQSVIDTAIEEWRKRLLACVRANGGHFEHQL